MEALEAEALGVEAMEKGEIGCWEGSAVTEALAAAEALAAGAGAGWRATRQEEWSRP